MNAMIESALANIAATVPAAALSMRHGTVCGSVISSSSIDLSGASLSGDQPLEKRRIIGRRRDFPALVSGVIVHLNGVAHLVTSARTDNTGTMLKIGLSAPIDGRVAVMSVRDDGVDRGGVFAALVELSGYDDPMLDGSPASDRQTVSIVIPALEKSAPALHNLLGWDETVQDGAPRIGDRITLEDQSQYAIISVRKDKDAFFLTAREVK